MLLGVDGCYWLLLPVSGCFQAYFGTHGETSHRLDVVRRNQGRNLAELPVLQGFEVGDETDWDGNDFGTFSFTFEEPP